ncbi:hypothetical protein [Pseudomonas aeruginosa]|uniref:hypothetical protein n=1 Tax=Pseudomonas aeruginosa TaxID=287 RepID=UPI0003BACF1C|nr:hypothetical protein [Pseudomonas aeruginosa]ERX27460.1 hypothetical protein Q010_06165 [Pseudomonas aeruginosa 19660]ERX31699.1 hypothetical protein Q010_04747 [Pseudomonas aeruginosa 19660]ORE42091.1 hypothetical protein B1H15_25350 [Pseudomonas aeruginosa]HDG9123445.1 hypothetical protein [Pseudomonas aeruginosa]
MRTGAQSGERFPYKEVLERMTKLSPTGCVAVVLPRDTPMEDCQKIADALKHVMAVPPLVICGDVQSLDEAAMNAAGWYRK